MSETKAHLVLIDETGPFLNPVVRRTWSIIGRAPVLNSDGRHRDKVSVIGGVSVLLLPSDWGFTSPPIRTDFHRREGRPVSPRPAEASKVIVVWEPGKNHKGTIIREFLWKKRRLHLEMLPPWAPDDNPMEDVWSWLKYGELANFTPVDIPELNDGIIDRLIRLKLNPQLLKALWNPCKLPLPTEPF